MPGAGAVKWRGDGAVGELREALASCSDTHLPPFPAPASLPAPLFCATRRVATSGWGIAPHAGATRRRNAWLSVKGRISSRFRSPSTPSVGSSKSKQAGGRGVCRCAAFCLSACCLFSALLPPPSPARPPLYPDEGQGPPHCSALFAASVYRLGGFSGQVRL